MNDPSYPGFFITLEGCEGSGKTTQSKLLAAWVESQGYHVLRTREPGGLPMAERIRAILLDPAYVEVMDARTELLLYAAARAQHVAQWIRPALAEGTIVICDRYVDATLAYQGYGRELSLGVIRDLHQIGTDGLMPDLTFLLDLPPEKGLQRVALRDAAPNRLEMEPMEFHRRVWEGYRRLASEEPDRYHCLDATDSVESIQEAMSITVMQTLRESGPQCSRIS